MKKYILIALTLILTSCLQEDPDTPNSTYDITVYQGHNLNRVYVKYSCRKHLRENVFRNCKRVDNKGKVHDLLLVHLPVSKLAEIKKVK